MSSLSQPVAREERAVLLFPVSPVSYSTNSISEQPQPACSQGGEGRSPVPSIPVSYCIYSISQQPQPACSQGGEGRSSVPCIPCILYTEYLLPGRRGQVYGSLYPLYPTVHTVYLSSLRQPVAREERAGLLYPVSILYIQYIWVGLLDQSH